MTVTCTFTFTFSLSLSLSLCDSAGGGTTPLATAPSQQLAVANGYFTSQPIDFGVGAFQGDARYLQIAVQCPQEASATTPAGSLTGSLRRLFLPATTKTR